MKVLQNALIAAILAISMFPVPADADALDDILARDTLRCAVVLDSPPLGFRLSDNTPTGFDAEYCNDLAAALGVKAEIVEVTWPERIPALISGKVDVAVASTSDTLERAKTVGFTIPYRVDTFQMLNHKGIAIKTFEDLKDKRVGIVTGNAQERYFAEYAEKVWGKNWTGKVTTYQSENELFLAVEQGQVDSITTTTIAIQNLLGSGKYNAIEPGPMTPWLPDVVALITLRNEYGWLNYLNLFINHEVRSGRYAELYKKWIKGPVPDLTIPGVYR